MTSNRLEAFSDGVLAIIITIMVLELSAPEEYSLAALWHTSGLGLLTYLLSFVYIGIYWNNHHHLFQVSERVNGAVLWANLSLLFMLSLLPFTTSWMDESHLAEIPVVVYGVNLLGAGTAYYLLEHAAARIPGQGERMREVFGQTIKERLSVVLYLVGIVLAALVASWLGLAVFTVVALIWVIPDRRVERYLAEG
jgi:TMEM175 potassium channel family protein